MNTSDAWSSGGIATPVPRPRQAAAAVDRQGERREPRQRPDPFGHELVERDRVAERAAGRVRGRGQEADVRRVAAVHVRVRHAAEHGEVGAMLLEQLQVRRGRVVAARVRRGRTAAAARRGCCRCRTSAAAPRAVRPPARTVRRIDSRNGSAIATAEPRRKRRREIGRRLDANGAVDRDPVCGFIAGLSYLFRNRSLCTIAWTRLRTPYWPAFAASRISLDLLPIGEPHRRAGGEDRQLPDQVPARSAARPGPAAA